MTENWFCIGFIVGKAMPARVGIKLGCGNYWEADACRALPPEVSGWLVWSPAFTRPRVVNALSRLKAEIQTRAVSVALGKPDRAGCAVLPSFPLRHFDLLRISERAILLGDTNSG